MEKTIDKSQKTENKIFVADLQTVQRIKNDPKFAYDFFFQTLYKMAVSISRIMTGTYWDLPYCDPEEICALMYEYFCCDGNWKKLDSYKGECELRYWVKRAILHHAFKSFDFFGYHRPFVISVSNSRLRIARLPKELREKIVNLLDVSDLYDILWWHVVEGFQKKKVCNLMDISPEEYDIKLKLAESALHETIIGTGDSNLMSIALACDIPQHMVDVTKIQHADADDDACPLTQAFREVVKNEYGIDHTVPEYQFRLGEVVEKISLEMGVSERDRKIWFRRYWHNEPSKEIAQDYGITDANVNLIKSRTDDIFVMTIRRKFKRFLNGYC